jgi:ABC-type transport system involved in multi-copper enzyme maturation permease subunit
VHREIAQRTVYALLAKPVRRWEFLAGKYAGLLALLALEVAIMSAFFGAVLVYKGETFTLGLAQAIGLIYLELALVTAVAMFFSSFTTPYLSGMFTMALWLTGHLLTDLRQFGLQSDVQGLRQVTEALYWSLPNLDRLDLKADAAAGNAIDALRVWGGAAYALLYSAGLMLGAMLLFQRRDFR